MTYLQKLRNSAEQTKSVVCMGLDPVVEAMPERYAVAGIKGVPAYFHELFREMLSQKVFPAAFKPNEGFYVVHDNPRRGEFFGSITLATVIGEIERLFPGIPIILDSKRADIAKSSLNYAKHIFEKWDVDATTISPYMGSDSVFPFTQFCNFEKGVYILNRTSNSGAADIQDAAGPGSMQCLYSHVVAPKIAEWAAQMSGVGAVVGATSLPELEDLARFYAEKDVPLLIPGVGGQGGKADEVANVLRNSGYDLRLARINSSSDLTHPWHKHRQPAPADYARVCVDNLREMHEQIGLKR
ncbi:orotidine-5'-phosphate decarboxylase [Candidatus Woesearchaeota archaeon]|nr:MAG: orotidine-5'-phosphate decarboxylase [Candidatus Woesearchaeota archaeon]